MPAPDPSLVRSIDAFTLRRQELRDRVTAAVVAEFAGFDGWYAPSLVAEVSAAAFARVSTGQRGTAALTDAHLSRVTSIVFGRAVSAAGATPEMGASLRIGVDDGTEVYERVASEYRRLRSLDESDESALSKSLTRAREMTAGDLGLAFQHQVQRFNQVNNVLRYRRIIRGEKSCGICVAASDRIYRKAELLPMHPGCDCDVLCVTHKTDPGSQLNNDTLGELYAEAGSTKYADLRKVRVEVVQHGEYGPQLKVVGHRFRGPADLAAAS